MKKLLYLILVVCFAFVSCDNQENAKEENLQSKITAESTKDEDFATLDLMRKDIIVYTEAETKACTNAQDWGMILLDPSQCSGNGGYIVYSKSVNLEILKKKIDEYNLAQGKVYEKWKILVDFCNNVSKPNRINCVDNKPQLFTDAY